MSVATEGTEILSRLSVLENSIAALARDLDYKVKAEKDATAIALTAADKGIQSALVVAERAVLKAEAAADKEYLGAQIKYVKELFRAEILALKDKIDAQLLASKEAITIANAANEERFKSTNEFRGTLSDQQANFAVKSEVDIRIKALDEKTRVTFESLEKKLDAIKTDAIERDARGAGISTAWGWLAGGVAMISIIVGLILLFDG